METISTAFFMWCKVNGRDAVPIDVPSADARLRLGWTSLKPTSILINGIGGMVAEDGSTFETASYVKERMQQLKRPTGADQTEPLALAGSLLTPDNTAAGPPVMARTFRSSTLMRTMGNRNRLILVDNTWAAAGPVGDSFERFWADCGDDLRNLRFVTMECGAEPDDDCYQAGADIYNGIYQFISNRCLGDVDRRSRATVFINEAVSGYSDAGRPDVCWTLLDQPSATANWIQDGRVVLEFKARALNLKSAQSQVIGRAATMWESRGRYPITLPGGASNGIVLQSVFVEHNGSVDNSRMYYTTSLSLVGTNISGTQPNSRHILVDTAGSAFRELTWHVFYAAGQHLYAQAASSLELKPGDRITIGIGSDAESRRSSTSSSSSSSSSSVISLCSTPEADPCTCVIRGPLGSARSSRAVYEATVVGGGYDGIDVILKLGACPEHQQMAVSLCESWESWFQVERELAARKGRNFEGVATLLMGGFVTSSSHQAVIGACGALFLHEGVPLVQPGQPMPQLSSDEAVRLLDSGVQALCELQAAGIHHNDVSPKNIARRTSPMDHKQASFYLYDLGLASSEGVQELYDALSASQQVYSVCPSLLAKFNPVQDLYFGSTAAINGDFLMPISDFESLLYVVISLLGYQLSWAAAAECDDEATVLQLRRVVRADPTTLPGWDSYPPELHSFAQSVLADTVCAALGNVDGWQAVQQAWKRRHQLDAYVR